MSACRIKAFASAMEMWPTSNKSKLSTREAGLHQADGAGLTTIKINNNQQQSTPLPCEDFQCSEKMWKRGHMFLYAIGCMFLHRCTRLPVERVGCCMQWLESGHWQFGVKSLGKHVQHKFTPFYITSCPSGSTVVRFETIPPVHTTTHSLNAFCPFKRLHPKSL